MLISTKHRFFLWVPSLMFIAMVLGQFERSGSGLLFRLFKNGSVSSLFLLIAAAFITVGDTKSFRTGIIMWILALVALMVLDRSVIMVIHL